MEISTLRSNSQHVINSTRTKYGPMTPEKYIHNISIAGCSRAGKTKKKEDILIFTFTKRRDHAHVHNKFNHINQVQEEQNNYAIHTNYIFVLSITTWNMTEGSYDCYRYT